MEMGMGMEMEMEMELGSACNYHIDEHIDKRQ